MELIRRLVQEDGQGLVEYVFILAVVVAIGLAVSATGFGGLIQAKLAELFSM